MAERVVPKYDEEVRSLGLLEAIREAKRCLNCRHPKCKEGCPIEDSLAECKEVQNTKRNLAECVRKIQQHGMQVQGWFILGFDNDKPSIYKRMISFIQQSGIVTAMVGMLNAPKGTKLYDRMENEGMHFRKFFTQIKL